MSFCFLSLKIRKQLLKSQETPPGLLPPLCKPASVTIYLSYPNLTWNPVLSSHTISDPKELSLFRKIKVSNPNIVAIYGVKL